jgi:hypothetical protein
MALDKFRHIRCVSPGLSRVERNERPWARLILGSTIGLTLVALGFCLCLFAGIVESAPDLLFPAFASLLLSVTATLQWVLIVWWRRVGRRMGEAFEKEADQAPSEEPEEAGQ